jgi:hypothetical protein
MERTEAGWWSAGMQICRAFLPVLVVALLGPVAAHAGAPNYDCTVAEGRGRLAIDQWRPRVVATGLGARSTMAGAVGEITQDGPSLDLSMRLLGTR